jgi:PilZ domain-containing protein
MSERRRATRQKSFLRGCIYFNNKRSATDCLVRDISSTGARLIFSDSVSIPDVVDLFIPQKDETLRAHVQWRHGDEVGVAFTKGGQAPAPGRSLDVGELVERVAKLEAELGSMRKMLKRLKAEIAGDADEAA